MTKRVDFIIVHDILYTLENDSLTMFEFRIHMNDS